MPDPIDFHPGVLVKIELRVPSELKQKWDAMATRANLLVEDMLTTALRKSQENGWLYLQETRQQ